MVWRVVHAWGPCREFLFADGINVQAGGGHGLVGQIGQAIPREHVSLLWGLGYVRLQVALESLGACS